MKTNEIRKEVKEKRNSLTKSEIEKFSKSIAKKFFALDFINEKIKFFVYNAIKNEVDTSQIINGLKKLGKEVSYPLTIGGEMVAVVPISDEWITGDFGVLIPKNYKKANSVDVAVIPLLACDKKLNRIGYGKGYYDKFLKENDCIKIGVCYDFQVIENIIPNEWDVPLDYIITPTKIIKN